MANAGGDISVVDNDGNQIETIILDGSLSSDLDGSIDFYEWTEGSTLLETGETSSQDFFGGNSRVYVDCY